MFVTQWLTMGRGPEHRGFSLVFSWQASEFKPGQERTATIPFGAFFPSNLGSAYTDIPWLRAKEIYSTPAPAGPPPASQPGLSQHTAANGHPREVKQVRRVYICDWVWCVCVCVGCIMDSVPLLTIRDSLTGGTSRLWTPR